jgi:gephyrin
MSQYKMISIPEAQEAVLAVTPVLGPEEAPLGSAVGRILAQSVSARDSLPPFPASIKVRRRARACGAAARAGEGGAAQLHDSPQQPSVRRSPWEGLAQVLLARQPPS